MRVIPILFFVLDLVYGQIGGAPYLKLGMDARGIAMGRSMTSLSEGPAAVYWNPAGLHTSEKLQIGFSATNMVDKSSWDQDYQTLALSVSWWRIGIGIGALQYGVTKIPEYSEDMNYLGEFDDQEMTGIFSLAFDFPGLMTIGMSGIYSQQEYVGLTQGKQNLESGLGVNFGIQLHPIPRWKNLKLGMLVNDKNSMGGADSTGIYTQAGLEWKLTPLLNKNYLSYVILSLGIEQERNYPIKLNGGAEIMMAKFSSLKLLGRLGFDDFVIEMRPLDSSLEPQEPELKRQIRRLNKKLTFGIGIENDVWHTQKMKLKFDYAIVKETFRVIHFISLGLVF